ncbi:MAG: maturase [Magnetospirillum sp.]|nr:maturase [Magnetospirillum sp.]
MGELFREVRKMRALEAAWRKVRARGLLSASKEIRAEVAAFDEHPIGCLRSLQDRLQANRFRFAPQKGVALKRQGKSSRPIVIAPVENRIVQRAILDTLSTKCRAVQAVLDIPTSVGGIEGVDAALAQVVQAMAEGATWCVRSDIPQFFTKIPKQVVETFITEATEDVDFTALFRAAVEVGLANAEQLGDEARLFPTADIGVAQGSALSPLIGNILLREFDRQLQGRGVTCIRYIDDFVLLAPTRASALAAFRSAKALLAALGLEAYDPAERPDKASIGPCADGFTFLGCHIQPGLIQPSDEARGALMARVRDILRDGRHAISLVRSDRALTGQRFAQTLALLDRVVKGWGDAFSFCTGRHAFQALDRKIDDEVNQFIEQVHRLRQSAPDTVGRRMLGVHALIDTPVRMLSSPRAAAVKETLAPV